MESCFQDASTTSIFRVIEGLPNGSCQHLPFLPLQMLSFGQSEFSSYIHSCLRPMKLNGFPRATCLPRCRCRKLPTALFLVDRQMYREAAIDVFYSRAWFGFMQEDLRLTMSFLCNKIPRVCLTRIRNVSFILRVDRCEALIFGAAFANGYPEPALERVAPWRVDKATRLLIYQSYWRVVLNFLSMNADLSKLTITVDMKRCPYSLNGDWILLDDYYGPRTRFIYDFAISITTALCSLKTIGSVRIRMDVFEQLTPWLEREVLGRGDMPQETRRLSFLQKIPPWHCMDCRLEGSNYHPETEPRIVIMARD